MECLTKEHFHFIIFQYLIKRWTISGTPCSLVSTPPPPSRHSCAVVYKMNLLSRTREILWLLYVCQCIFLWNNTLFLGFDIAINTRNEFFQLFQFVYFGFQLQISLSCIAKLAMCYLSVNHHLLPKPPNLIKMAVSRKSLLSREYPNYFINVVCLIIVTQVSHAS